MLNDDLTLPPGGQGRARVIQAAASEPQLDISLADGMDLGQSMEFSETTAYSNVPEMGWTLQVSAGNEMLAETPFTVDAGAVYSVLILDTPTGLAVVTQVDALATAFVPTGSVDTGGGGMATDRLPSSSATAPQLALLLSGLALIALAGLLGSAAGAKARAS